MKDTPLLNAVKDLAPLIVQVCCSRDADEALEARLRDKLNAEFGDTAQSADTLDTIHAALQKVLR